MYGSGATICTKGEVRGRERTGDPWGRRHRATSGLEFRGFSTSTAIEGDRAETVGRSGTAFLMRGQHGYFGTRVLSEILSEEF